MCLSLLSVSVYHVSVHNRQQLQEQLLYAHADAYLLAPTRMLLLQVSHAPTPNIRPSHAPTPNIRPYMPGHCYEIP